MELRQWCRRLGQAEISQSGWRRAAVLNTIGIGIFALFLIVLLIYSSVKAGGVNRVFIFFVGTCKSSKQTSIGLHLLLNILSTAVIASSNFFMQVLNSPTRKEADAAHQKGKHVEVGVPSIRNILLVAPSRNLLWAAFCLSSVPIHLFFNSAIFETEFGAPHWRMAMVSEGFLAGRQYFLPGASLMLAGEWKELYLLSTFNGTSETLTWTRAEYGTSAADEYAHFEEWQKHRDWLKTEYSDQSSDTMRFLRNASLVASSQWTHIEPDDCKEEYASYNARQKLRDVILVLRSDNPLGWTRSEMFNLNAEDSVAWDRYIPADKINSLWFYAECTVKSVSSDYGLHDTNDCGGALGMAPSLLRYGAFPAMDEDEVDNWDWIYFPRLNSTATNISASNNTGHENTRYQNSANRKLTRHQSTDKWTYSFVDIEPDEYSQPINFDPRPFKLKDEASNQVEVLYCLAREVEDPKCKVGLSNTLLLVVTVCVLFKTGQCLLAIFSVSEDLLVTPGDAMESYLSVPSNKMSNLNSKKSTGNQNENDAENTIVLASKSATPENLTLLQSHVQDIEQPVPARWQKKTRRPLQGLGLSVWVRTYFLLSVILTATALLLSIATKQEPVTAGLAPPFDHGMSAVVAPSFFQEYRGIYLPSVLLANSPQIVLSVAYFVYNSFFTRVLAEREWNAYSQQFLPLRVTKPVGEQISTYRLQLPYTYSVPLLVISALLHWLVSSTIYIVISEGGYRSWSGPLDYGQNRKPFEGPGISDDAFVGISYSSTAILIVLLLGIVMAVIPALLSWIKMRGDMTVGATNSLVILKACRATTAGLIVPKPDLLKKKPTLLQLLSPKRRKTDQTSSTVNLCSSPGDDIEMQTTPVNKKGQFKLSPANDSSHDLSMLDADEISLNSSEDHALLLQLSRSKLRWGVVRMPDEFKEQFKHLNEYVGHLTFGTVEQKVQEPEHGALYA